MTHKTHCIYCGGQSSFIVQLRNESNNVVGVTYVCESCRNLIVETSSVDLWWKNNRIKTHITDVPPVIHSPN